jgi:cell division protein FtsL
MMMMMMMMMVVVVVVVMGAEGIYVIYDRRNGCSPNKSESLQKKQKLFNWDRMFS